MAFPALSESSPPLTTEEGAMTNPTEHHLEHATHGHGHAAHGFEKKVAMTIAIIAAILAGTTSLSHRGHTEVLRLQTEANVKTTRESDAWAYYQAKNIRKHYYRSLLESGAA